MSSKASSCLHKVHHCQLSDTLLHTQAIVELCRVLSMPHRCHAPCVVSRLATHWGVKHSPTSTQSRSSGPPAPSRRWSGSHPVLPLALNSDPEKSWQWRTREPTASHHTLSHFLERRRADEATAPLQYRKRNRTPVLPPRLLVETFSHLFYPHCADLNFD